jgi:hypothetical protein
MKKTLLLAAIATAIFTTPAHAATSAPDTSGLYSWCGIITVMDYKNDLVTVETANGLQYTFYGCEDYFGGDLVDLLMWDNGTPETVLDDLVIDANYSGFVAEELR